MSKLLTIVERGLSRKVVHRISVEIIGAKPSDKTLDSLQRMTNKDKAEFLEELIKSVKDCCIARDASLLREGDLFLSGLINTELLRSSGRFFFTLTAAENEFSCWFAAPDTFGPEHFGGSQENCLFTATCEDSETLKGWANSFNSGFITFENPTFGKIWFSP